MDGFLLAQLIMHSGLGGLDIEAQSGSLAASGRTVLTFSPQTTSHARVCFALLFGPMISETIEIELVHSQGVRPRTFKVTSPIMQTGVPLWVYSTQADPLRVQITNSNASGAMPYDLALYSLDVITLSDLVAVKKKVSDFANPRV